MKSNFKKSTSENYKEFEIKQDETDTKPLTKDEFENYILDSGAKGSFMIYRSDKKDEELGVDEL
tara:strand:+ start:1656 stop:1847 length:192 start_codon:yes stop_codon:yes gene_type:complete